MENTIAKDDRGRVVRKTEIAYIGILVKSDSDFYPHHFSLQLKSSSHQIAMEYDTKEKAEESRDELIHEMKWELI